MWHQIMEHIYVQLFDFKVDDISRPKSFGNVLVLSPRTNPHNPLAIWKQNTRRLQSMDLYTSK